LNKPRESRPKYLKVLRVWRRKLQSNRLWVITNHVLFVRSALVGVEGSLPGDWVYRRLGSDRRTVTSESVAALVMDLGRFGNASARVARAAALTARVGWPFLLIPRIGFSPGYAKSVAEEDFLLGSGLRVSFGDESWRGQREPRLLIRRDFSSAKIAPAAREMRIQSEVTTAMFPGLVPHQKTDGGLLTIHLRSGDIFYRDGLFNWGQPPLAYYIFILESSDWSSVCIVTQDQQSPVLGPLVRYCHSKNLGCIVQSSSFQDDVLELAGATSLVAGRGTFVPAIVLIAPSLSTLYYFEDRCDLHGSAAAIEVCQVVDLAGIYKSEVLGGKWINSPEQRALMTEYPVRNLGWGEVTKLK
jgi:hypothetical protein